jgi:hypothetical protein
MGIRKTRPGGRARLPFGDFFLYSSAAPVYLPGGYALHRSSL